VTRDSQGTRTIVILFGALLLLGARHVHVIHDSDYSHSIRTTGNLRPAIYSRTGLPLAISRPVFHVFHKSRRPPSKVLAKALLKEGSGKNLTAPGYVIKNLDPDAAKRIRPHVTDDFVLQSSRKRFYPFRELFSHPLGFLGDDGHGLEGLEHAWNKLLRGGPVYSSLSVPVQAILAHELRKALRDRTEANWAGAILADGRSGEILGWTQEPRYNPNRFRTEDQNKFRSRLLVDYYEPGSVFKIWSALMAIRWQKEKTVYYCPGEKMIFGFPLRCDKPHGRVQLPEILAHSCNLGMNQRG